MEQPAVDGGYSDARAVLPFDFPGSAGVLRLDVRPLIGLGGLDQRFVLIADAGLFIREPKLGLDHNLQAWIKDPDGNAIELMQITPESPQRAVADGREPVIPAAS